MNHRTFLFLCLLLLPLSGIAQGWKPALPGYQYQFPRDHGQHPDQKIEWWYVTGNVETVDHRRFGYQLTFFRIGVVTVPASESKWALRDVWMAHLAVSDVQNGVYRHADRLNRSGPGIAGATEARIWNEDWSMTVGADAMKLSGSDGDFGLELSLGFGKPVVVHGRDGISQKGDAAGNASHYYSMTRMPTRGAIMMGNETFEVTGSSWMDHEFGSSFLEVGTAGWDWFSAQLNDGSELMLFQLRSTEPGKNVPQSAGTLIRKDGSTVPLTADEFTLKPGEPWKAASGALYPQQWQIQVPSQGIVLQSRAIMPDQEFRAAATPGLQYWEGAVDYTGTVGKAPVTGLGYLEMTGYAGQSMSVWFGGK
jgi:predicted secreted hydrolase